MFRQWGAPVQKKRRVGFIPHVWARGRGLPELLVVWRCWSWAYTQTNRCRTPHRHWHGNPSSLASAPHWWLACGWPPALPRSSSVSSGTLILLSLMFTCGDRNDCWFKVRCWCWCSVLTWTTPIYGDLVGRDAWACADAAIVSDGKVFFPLLWREYYRG